MARPKSNKYKKILDKKKETSSKDLCMNFPDEFREYVEYTRNLDYEEEPKYEKYRNKFYNLICKKRGESFDYIYDWTTESDLKRRESPQNEDTEFKATATKDAEIRSKIKEREKIMVAMNNTSNNNNLNPLRVSNNLNNLNQPSIKEEDIMKMEENNIVTDKVDSRCCTM